MRKHFLFTVLIALLATTTFATTLGPQSIKVTFNDGTNKEGWDVIENKGTASVSSGLLNVTMAVQKVEDDKTKYRADIKNAIPDTYSFDKTKDSVWAIKLTGSFGGNLTLEAQYKDSENKDKYINGTNIKSTINCANGGVIYYLDATSQLSTVPDGTVNIKMFQVKMADAVFADVADAHYSVDWIATFASVNDLKAFANWNDEDQEDTPSLPYYEACFRPKTDGTGYVNNSAPYNGFTKPTLEAYYYGQLCVVEYFLVEDFRVDKKYQLVLSKGANHSHDSLAVWNFPYEVDTITSASDIKEKIESTVGINLARSEGKFGGFIDSVQFNNNEWTFTIPGYKLSKIRTIDNKSLVGLLITTKQYNTENKKGLFASGSNNDASLRPSFTFSGNYVDTIVNLTKQRFETSLRSAINNSEAGDVIMMRKNDTIKDTRVSINHALTIQGATAETTIGCDVPANTILFLATENSGSNYAVTLKNLTVDCRNATRSIQAFDSNNKGQFCIEDVKVINASYPVESGDVKPNGNNPVILKGNNSFARGIVLNRNKYVKHDGATHMSPIHLILAGDFNVNSTTNCKIVEGCTATDLYTVEDALGEKTWEIAVDGSNLKVNLTGTVQYKLNVKEAANGMSTLVLGFDATLPAGVTAYRLEMNNNEIYAYEESSIQARKPVLIVATPGEYTFTSVDATIDETNDPKPTYGALVGNFQLNNATVPACEDPIFNYILTKENGVVGFYQVGDATNKIAKNRAYLSCNYDVNADVAPGAPRRSMRIVFQHNGTTDIESATMDTKVQKQLIDGVIYIRKADHLYRIDGQLVK